MSTLAAIDVGSQAVRLSIVRLSPLGELVDEEFRRWPLRLGADTFAHGRIRPARQRALLDTFVEIKTALAEANVDGVRAVATAALRDAANGRQLLDRVRATTSVRVRLIGGGEEGRLARDALLRALGSLPDGSLLVDLGGGSLEVRRAGSARGRSLPLGTVRLLEERPALRRPLTPRAVDALVDELCAHLRRRLPGGAAAVAVGTGGCLDVLARLAPLQRGLHPTIALRRLPALTRRIAALPPAERVRCFNLRPDRADVVLPAALVIEALAAAFAVDALVVPGTGIRDALLRELAVRRPHPWWGALAAQLVHADPRRRRVARLAELLFQLLRPLHRLWPPGGLALRAAALWRDNPRHRDAAPFARAIATIADGGPRWLDELPTEHQRAVSILAGLLRLAGALSDRGVEQVQLDLTRNPVRLLTGARPALPAQAVRPLSAALERPLLVR